MLLKSIILFLSFSLKKVLYISSFKVIILSEPNNSLNLSKTSVEALLISLIIKELFFKIFNNIEPGLNTNWGLLFFLFRQLSKFCLIFLHISANILLF